MLSPSRRAFLLCLAARIVPESAALDADGRARFFTLIEDFLRGRPASVRRQVGLFLTVLRWLPALRYHLPLDLLLPAEQDAALRWFQDGPIALFRKGFWGVKALVFMGYYARPGVSASLNYSPSKSGNTYLHA